MPLGVPPREGRNRGETRSVQPGDLPARRMRIGRTGCSATGGILRASWSRQVRAGAFRPLAPVAKDRMTDTITPRATLTVCITCKREGMPGRPDPYPNRLVWITCLVCNPNM